MNLRYFREQQLYNFNFSDKNHLFEELTKWNGKIIRGIKEDHCGGQKTRVFMIFVLYLFSCRDNKPKIY